MNTKNIIDKLKTCEYCNREFDSPVILPCGETCCRKHLKDMLKEDHYNLMICYFCGREHEYSDKEDFYPQNKLIIKLIDLNAENLSLEKCISSSIDAYEELKAKIEELEQASTNPSTYLHDYFISLKNKIDLKKVECDLTAEKIHDKMLHDLRVFENECQSALDVVNKNKLQISLNELTEKVNQLKRDVYYLQNTKDKNEIDTIDSEILKLKSTVDYELKELKEKLFLGMEFTFEPKHLSINSNLFGLFKMEYPLVKKERNILLKI